MLVLTRKVNQSVAIGDPASEDPIIEVTVIEVRGDQVRLGIKAPQNVAVHRTEVYLQIQQENEAASQTPTSGPVLTKGAASTVGMTLEQIRRRAKPQH